MLVLFESAVGYAVFKVSTGHRMPRLELSYQWYVSIPLRCRTSRSSRKWIICTKKGKKLKKMLKKVVLKDGNEELAVADAKLGNAIKDKLNIGCVTSQAIQELMSCIRSQIENLIPEWVPEDEAAMQLGLSHGIGRYKLKFSPDKVDTMIIQAVSLLDDLDKELNNYVMRSKEWYGWHFPELSKIVTDNSAFIRTVLTIGMRANAATTDLSDILPEEVEAKVKEMAEVSMGTEIADEDMLNIHHLCQNVLDLQEYRTQLFEYLKNRMLAIAPNLTILVGELVGARLISHAGSLLNLAKHPASTVQILGAEKALPNTTHPMTDNSAFIRTVLTIGMRANAATTDLSDILPEEVEAKVKEMAEVSMGTEIADEDMLNIHHLCQNVLDLQEYRTQLFEYLKNRMLAIAPNLTILVGELVGARLISHAGSLDLDRFVGRRWHVYNPRLFRDKARDFWFVLCGFIPEDIVRVE
ncbi:unnamed protein product [Oppiella nova]|uniref:Nop domain-containing protein n=1 Tax=Oppiella nova TaxID=334625 RepID=A0A7R9LJP1_9ACAR|nr:unnamed protein product [Oppiella nova]CAG2163656.1 unnamed protein product [Oppiella nova]